MKKTVLVILIVIISLFLLTACGSSSFIGQNGKDGINGVDGKDGKDGATPLIQIGEDNYWYVSHDNGTTWENLGEKATGEKGENGKNGENGENGENGKNGENGTDGVDGKDGNDGTTPLMKIGEDNYWYVSHDNGTTWENLGEKATGEKGEKGENGTDGVDGKDGNDGTTPLLKVGDDNFWYVSYDNGVTWQSLDVWAGDQTHEHIWNEGETVIESTDTTSGVAFYSCTIENCYASKFETIEKKSTREYVAEWVNGGFENGAYTNNPTFCRVNKFSLPYGGIISVDTGDQYVQIWKQETLENVTSTQTQITTGWFKGKSEFEVLEGIYAIAVVDSSKYTDRNNITSEDVEVTVKITEYLTQSEYEKISNSVSYPNELPSKAQQGMSIYNGNAYLLTNAGGCVIYNLSSKQIISSYTLPNANSSNHCNSASFAGMLDGEPLLYVSECYGNHDCFVYKMGLESATLVQTITFDNAKGEYKHTQWRNAFDWIVDYDSKKIMTYGLLPDGRHKIKVFNLPLITETVTVLTEEDVIDQWVVEDYMDGDKISTYQGNCVYGDKIFLADSKSNSVGYIYIFDKNTHELISAKCYTTINKELEDCCVYDGKLYTITAGGMIHCFDVALSGILQ